MAGAPTPGGTITREDKSRVVQPCSPAAKKPTDPVVNDQLNCIDIETTGARTFRRSDSLLEIVQTKATDTVVITYSGPVIPPYLNVTRDGAPMPPAKGGGKYSYDVTYAPEEQPYVRNGWLSLPNLFTANHVPTVYAFSHPDLPRTIEVHVYNPDQWSFAYDPPPAKSYSLGAKLDNQSAAAVAVVSGPGGTAVAGVAAQKTTFDIKTSASTGGLLISSKTEREIQASVKAYVAGLASPNLYALAAGAQLQLTDKTTGPDTGAMASVASFLTQPPVSLKLNGANVEVDFLTIVGVLVSLKQTIQDVLTMIRKFQSLKMGWYVEMKAEFFDGKLQADWGWREDTSWEVYYYTALLLELKIFSVAAEIGLGVEVGGVGAQVCAGLSGELTYEIKSFEVKAPSSKPSDDLDLGEVTGTITAGVYARVKAGDVLQITGAGTAPVKVTSSMSWKKKGGFSSDVSIVAEGLIVSFQVKSYVSMKPKSATLIEGGTLGNFTFPGGDTPKSEDFTSEGAIADAIRETFDAGWWPILFYDSVTYTDEGVFWDSQVTKEFAVGSERIAAMAAAKIWRHRDKLDLSSATVEGLTHSIRKASEIMGKRFGRDKVSIQQMRSYLDGGFQSVIEAAYSPAKLYRLSLAN